MTRAMSIEFSLNLPQSDAHQGVAAVRLLEGNNEFLSEAVLLGYHPGPDGTVERRGMVFNTQCQNTGVKHAIVLFNLAEVDIGLVVHEIRHAYLWVVSNHHGHAKVDLLNEGEEELFCSRLDELIDRTITTIEATGHTLVWRKGR